ncbi:MAG: TetR/AcrR family transcriptional regulator [Acidimicrobiales bacterium]
MQDNHDDDEGDSNDPGDVPPPLRTFRGVATGTWTHALVRVGMAGHARHGSSFGAVSRPVDRDHPDLSKHFVAGKSICRDIVGAYTGDVPKLWTDTIEEHRRDVSDAILRTTAQLVADHGLLSVTMSRIAEETGIGRATLYKYYPDVEAILREWHGRQIADHLQQLTETRDRTAASLGRLRAVLEAYALISHQMHGHADSDLAALLHRDAQVTQAEHQLRDLFRALLTDAAQGGEIRDDVPTDELADYCLHSLTAASRLSSKAAVRRLVNVTLAGLEPPD